MLSDHDREFLRGIGIGTEPAAASAPRLAPLNLAALPAGDFVFCWGDGEPSAEMTRILYRVRELLRPGGVLDAGR